VTKAQYPNEIAPGLRIRQRAKEKGLIIRAEKNWIAFGPPLVISRNELDLLLDILEASIAEVDRVLCSSRVS
jgi:adenosylmethionine-8-amino-7-oxononanoate aminotransferase